MALSRFPTADLSLLDFVGISEPTTGWAGVFVYGRDPGGSHLYHEYVQSAAGLLEGYEKALSHRARSRIRQNAKSRAPKTGVGSTAIHQGYERLSRQKAALRLGIDGG